MLTPSAGLRRSTIAPPATLAYDESGPMTAQQEKSRTSNLAVAAALVGLAVAAKWTEVQHIDKQLWAPAALVDTSMGHLAIGYIPAWASVHVIDKWRSSKTRTAAYSAATALATTVLLDAGVEAAQMLHTTEQYANPLSSANTPETIKDGLFALAGTGLYYYLNRRKPAVAQKTSVTPAAAAKLIADPGPRK